MENLKSNLSKYNYPDSLIKQGFPKALSIPQKDLRKPKKLSNENILPFITSFNLNNPNIYSTIKSLVTCLKNNSVSGFHNIKLIQSKCHKRCECCNYLLINDHYTLKNVQITFRLKNCFTCDSFNLINVVICGKCKEEYIGEIGEGQI